MDGAVGGLRHLEPDPRLLRHHIILGLLTPGSRRGVMNCWRCREKLATRRRVLVGSPRHPPPPVSSFTLMAWAALWVPAMILTAV